MPEYELSDISAKYISDTSLNAGGRKSKGLMYVSPAKAFILAFLAIAVAVGVGIIVHFAGPARDIECKCAYPAASGGSNGGTTAAMEQCKDWATSGNADICNACPSATQPPCPTTAVPPTGITTTAPGETTPDTSVTTQAPPVLNVRLPLYLEPLLYTVELQPHMYAPTPKEEFTFNGSMSVVLHCRTRTSTITLHINKLNVTGSISITGTNGNTNLYSSHTFDKQREFIIFNTNTELVPGQNYTLAIGSFEGPLVADLAGLYLSSYKRGNETIHIATTQLQATDARKTFPCMDEPAIKAKFDVTLVRKSHMKSLSNTPIIRNVDRYMATTFLAPVQARYVFPCLDEPALKAPFSVTLVRKASHIALSNTPISHSENRGNDWIADVFETTPKMSTYLLAFIICDFLYIEEIATNTTNDVKYRAYSRPEAISQANYSLDQGVRILTFFEDYFNISYPLPKQDMIAIPDFAAGAMENWGLITYRETAMLYEPGVSSEGNKQRVAVVVSHELAHQWFGNLVTPSWWDDLWLNEGFASYVEYMGVDHTEPDWRMFEQFVVEDLQDVFNFDGLISSHPVYVPVSHPDQINEIFDRISYAKGASIIRMMRFFLGDKVFQRGLTSYLKKLSYDAAFHDDLWYALGNQSTIEGKTVNVKGIMDTWTLQMNYPVVHVKHEGARRISMSQKRYLRDPNATDPGKYTSPFGYTWEIPFAYTTSDEKRYDVNSSDVIFMKKTDGPLAIDSDKIPAPGGANWVLGNPMQYGYYRVNYDDQNWMSLIEQLKRDHTAIHPVNRAQIINDAWNLAKSGDLHLTVALGTTAYLDNERDYMPWTAVSSELGFVQAMLERHPLYGSFSNFMRNKTKPVFDDITMNNTGASHMESFLRSIIVTQACDYNIEACTTEALRLFRQWMNNPSENPIDPGIKTAVYCTAVWEGGIEEWEFALNQYRAANLAAEQSRLLGALACSREVWILSRFLEMSIDENEIRRQDAVGVIVSVSRNTIGRSLAWDFFRAKWDFLLNDFGGGSFSFSNLIGGLTSNLNTQYDIDQLKAFVDSKDDLGSGARAFDQALERTQSNINWMTTNVPIIEKWLTEQGF